MKRLRKLRHIAGKVCLAVLCCAVSFSVYAEQFMPVSEVTTGHDGVRGRILARAVSQLSRQAERVKNALTTRHLARFTSSLTGLQCLRSLVNDALSRRGVLFKILRPSPAGSGGLKPSHEFPYCRSLALGLTLELRVAEFN